MTKVVSAEGGQGDMRCPHCGWWMPHQMLWKLEGQSDNEALCPECFMTKYGQRLRVEEKE